MHALTLRRGAYSKPYPYFLPNVIPKSLASNEFIFWLLFESIFTHFHILIRYWEKVPRYLLIFKTWFQLALLFNRLLSIFMNFFMRVLHNSLKLHTNFERKFLHKGKASRKFLFRRQYFEILHPYRINTYVSFINRKN
jgi:hypothetical protein